MEVQVEETASSCVRKVSVNVPADAVELVFAKVVRKISKDAHLPGFRPGKIPRSLLLRHFGEAINQEVKTELIEGTLAQALNDKALVPLLTRDLQTGVLNNGAQFSYTAEVEIAPEITLNTWEGLPVPILDASIADDLVDKELEALRRETAQLVPVLVRDTVQAGDLLIFDYEGHVEGRPLERTENAQLEIEPENQASFLPGLSEKLIGATVPGKHTVRLTFPADYQASEMAGKEIVLEVALKELKARELPALDDAFANDLGVETLEALRGRVLQKLQAVRQQEIDREQRQALLKALVAVNPFEVPPSLVATQQDMLVADLARQAKRLGMPALDPAMLEGYRRQSQGNAEFLVRGQLLLHEVAVRAELEITPAEIEDAIAQQASQLDAAHVEQMLTYFDAPEHREALGRQLMEAKTIALLLARATPTAAEEAAAPVEASAATASP